MRSKSFAERIADVLIDDGLLLPSQLEEAVGIQQKEGGRLLKILTDRQFEVLERHLRRVSAQRGSSNCVPGFTLAARL